MLLRLLVPTISVGAAIAFTPSVFAQEYPQKPIRLVTSGVGGGLDFAARLISPGLATGLGQPVIVDNQGGGILPNQIVAKAPPDGYTLLLNGGVVWLLPFMRDNLPWDPLRDFSPISLAVTSPNILVVHPSVPAKSVKDLIALAKARPGELNYSSGSKGGGSHLAAELFKALAAIDVVDISYKGGSAEIVDLLAGRLHFTFGTAGSVGPYVKSNKLRALAVTSSARSATFPELPTVAASGLPGYESGSILGVFAPAKTPATIITRVNQEVVRVLQQPDVKQKFFNSGVETVGSSPEEFAATIKSEMARMGKVIKDAGIRVE